MGNISPRSKIGLNHFFTLYHRFVLILHGDPNKSYFNLGFHVVHGMHGLLSACVLASMRNTIGPGLINSHLPTEHLRMRSQINGIRAQAYPERMPVTHP